MDTLDLIILILSVCLFVNFVGYILALRCFQFFYPVRRKDRHKTIKERTVNIVIPVFNESNNIQAKIADCLNQNYERISIHIIDGGSTDDSRTKMEAYKDDERIHLYYSKFRNKIKQLNYVLRLIPEHEYVLCTDCDARLPDPSAVRIAVERLETDQELGLVGGWCTPKPAIDIEIGYWDKQNRLRHLESSIFSSSIVVAPFYCFLRSNFSLFPEDCLADDVYISHHMHLTGKRILYDTEIDVIETRSAGGIASFCQHKLRKANAYTIELLRLIHNLPQIEIGFRLFYIFRLFQFFYLPWVLVFYLAAVVYSFFIASYTFSVQSLVFLFLGTLVASIALKPPKNRSRGGLKPNAILATLQGFVLMNFILIINFLSFPFIKYTASYNKVEG